MKTRAHTAAHSGRVRLWVWLAGLALQTTGLAADTLSVRDRTYSCDDQTVSAFEIENHYFRALLVPACGGRVMAWFDKTAKRDLVHAEDYGGLLDDHGSRPTTPYEFEWIVRGPQEAAVRLRLPDTVVYEKTVRFFHDRPVVQVDYHFENHGQSPHRLLLRNVVRPGGAEISGKELHCYSRVAGLKRQFGMPRTDDQADPWCAMVHPEDQVVVANSFEGDTLARLYTWLGSKVAPTYEFMFRSLEPGHQYEARYYWLLCHGLAAVDYSHRNFAAQIEGGLQDHELKVELSLVGTWAPMPDLIVSGEILDPERKKIADLPAAKLELDTLDRVIQHSFAAKLGASPDYAILLLKLRSAQLPTPIIVEKPFPRDGDEKLLATYTRPVRWLGPPVVQRPIEGWEREVKYEIQPGAEDKERGFMVFEESGEHRGRHIRNLALHLAQREPESFPLHFHSLSLEGPVKLSVKQPAGLALETFVPEKVPETIWQQVRYGYKLLPGNSFIVKPGEDRVLYFRLKADDLPPGQYEAAITFEPEKAPAATVAVGVEVHPIRFPEQPYLVFDVNNVANYLCAEKKGYEWRWSELKARNYLDDMAQHQVRGQTLIGTNSPSSHYYYRFVRDRETGLSLPDAIKGDPARFRQTELPALDFSYWDWLVERLLEHGTTHVRWPMGGCGDGFLQSHAQLTKLVYGQTFPPGDVRHLVIQEWYLRELSRYLRDRGITRVMGSIDDEIPSEKLGWWVQHAYRSIQMGIEPGVTQSAATLYDDQLMNLVAPFMKFWIIGTLHKPTLDRRRSENIIRPEHWVTTYHSSACHWQTYEQMRGQCGLNPAYFDLDACWIQVYYRWRQSEAVIYPGKDGPLSSAAWEGARDGLDDGNFLLLARAMIRVLPDEPTRQSYQERLQQIVGEQEDSLIRFGDTPSRLGTLTTMLTPKDIATFRQAKQRLLALIDELADRVPVQKANVMLGNHRLIRDGKPVHRIPADLRFAGKAEQFLHAAADPLAVAIPDRSQSVHEDPFPIFFCGTLPELKQAFAPLAAHPDLADLSPKYPVKGSYVIRFVTKPSSQKPNSPVEAQTESLVLVCGDEAGADKALDLLLHVVKAPKTQYSHWISQRMED
ncbi:MAG: hypothetical protein ISR77_39195 [Pirellulaceae bacterium]|nr:hypothetical protein [Pirellulaceae bacterium]